MGAKLCSRIKVKFISRSLQLLEPLWPNRQEILSTPDQYLNRTFMEVLCSSIYLHKTFMCETGDSILITICFNNNSVTSFWD